MESPGHTPRQSEPVAAAIKPTRAGNSYLPTLDGWRALAILMVLASHGPTVRLWKLSSAPLHYEGDFGVAVFFALSGLLICSRLLDEERLIGKIHLGRFYIRRFFRIQPLAFVFTTLVVALTLLHRIPSYPAGIVASYLFVRNYVGWNLPMAVTWMTGHFWSLSIEEHFYLLLPAFLVFVKRHRLQWLFGLGIAGIFWRLHEDQYINTSAHFLASHRTDTCLTFLLIPSAFAVLLQREKARAFVTTYVRPFWVLPLLLVCFPNRSPLHIVANFLCPLFILASLLHPRTLAGRLLENPALRYIGRISYSLYVWQQLFFTNYWTGGALHPLGRLNDTQWTWPCVFLTAIASYHLLEKPLMKIGHRMAPSTTPGRL